MPDIQLRVQVFDQRMQSRLCTRLPSSELVWSTGERLEGQILVVAPLETQLGRLAVSLIGYHRVWALKSGPGEVPSFKWATYKFLHQSLDISTLERQPDSDDGTAKYTSPFGVTIPEQIVTQVDSVPDQCLLLPPSMTVGRVLYGIDGDQYAQPRIEYRIHAVIKSTSDSDSNSTVAQTDKEVTIMPCSEPSPPIDTDDFPGEFIQFVTYPFRTSFLGPRYQMKLSLLEPMPMFTRTVLHSTTNLRLRIDVDISTKKGSRDLASLSKVLKSMRFKARFALRAKTFYATRPFSQMPGYTMANAHGLPNIHDSASETHTVDISSSCWRPHFHSDALHPNDVSTSPSNFDLQPAGTDIISPSDSVPSINQWSTTLEIMVPVEGALIPTFCSAIASRQYSIVARIKAKGGPLKEFLLEMPVQNHCSPPLNPLQSTGNTQSDWSGRNGSSTRSGAREPASDVLDADAPDDGPPEYF